MKFTRSNPPSNFYVYAYLREDNTPYYIGKGKDKRAWKRNKRHFKRPLDQSRIAILAHNLCEDEAFLLEKILIRAYGRKDLGTGILRNQTDGGDGFSGLIPWNKNKTGIQKMPRRSDEHKNSIRTYKEKWHAENDTTGRNNANSKTVKTPSGVYYTVIEAAKAHNISVITMREWIKRKEGFEVLPKNQSV